MVRPASVYFTDELLNGERASMVQRMRCARRVFDPLYVQGNPVTAAQVKALAIFKCSKHPAICAFLSGMEEKEIAKYNALCSEIPEKHERMQKKRRTDKEVDTFDYQAWWRSNRKELPNFAGFLRAVLCHAPSSCPPERAFSTLNNTFRPGQSRARAYKDYLELSCRLQYNARTRNM